MHVCRLLLGVCVFLPVLRDVLHWLPVTVPQTIQFKIAALTFDCVWATRPAYFNSIACTVAAAELLHCSSSCLELTATSPSLPSISYSQFRAGHKTYVFRLMAFQWLFLWELLTRVNWTEPLYSCHWLTGWSRGLGPRCFLADCTNGRAYATVLRLSVVCVSVTLCIVAKRCVLE